MLNKLLALGFVALILGKVFFRPQFKAVTKWFDGVVNAMLLAIALAYSIQVAMWLTS